MKHSDRDKSQLEFDWEAPPQEETLQEEGLPARRLHRELQRRTGGPVALTITDNTSNMMSVLCHTPTGEVRVRLHRMFLTASDDVLAALAHWIQHPRSRKHGPLFREFIASRRHQIRQTLPSSRSLRTRGKHHDLLAIYREINDGYFQGNVDADITWGRDTVTRTRSIRFGSYLESANLIRIHPRLDREFVPACVVRYIVYHEMLHAHLKTGKIVNGRRRIHTREFKSMEKRFPDYAPAVAWIASPENLNRLLSRQGPKEKRK